MQQRVSQGDGISSTTKDKRNPKLNDSTYTTPFFIIEHHSFLDACLSLFGVSNSILSTQTSYVQKHVRRR